jgi:hypothetical protein
MDQLSVRSFEKKDADFAYEMTVREQWSVSRADVGRMFRYEPNGCSLLK